MADDREPPPLFGEDDDEEITENDNDDLFSSVSEATPKATTPAEVKTDEEDKQDVDDDVEDKQDDQDDDDTEDIFAEAQTEVPLDSPDDEKRDFTKEDIKEPIPAATPFSEPPRSSPATMKAETTSSTVSQPITSTTTIPSSRSTEEIEEEEGGDTFHMEITITEPKKVGDGMNAYMAYKVNTKTTLPEFKSTETAVYRRFSDFLGLHEKLVEHHQHTGIIIPPPPEKSVLGMTKIKMSKEEAGSAEFVEKRRAALERFVNRTAKHPELRHDTSFVEFLSHDGDLPRSTSTSALSGAGVMRLFSKVGDSFGKMTFKMDETDQWFEDKQQQIESMDHQLRKLHTSIEALVQHRKELALNTGSFAKSAAMLGNAEEHTALSRALSQLAEVEEKVDQLHMDQADNDFFVLAELVKDYVTLISAIKGVFLERVKIFKTWKEAEQNLNKKREVRAKLELQRKLDKIPPVSQEISVLEDKVEKGQEDFEKISRNIRKELSRFEKQRVKDFKATIIHYLESLMNSQQQLIKYWDTFLPEAKAIA